MFGAGGIIDIARISIAERPGPPARDVTQTIRLRGIDMSLTLAASLAALIELRSGMR
jgi:hypothetical protein